jgi:hypothetical protein
MLTPQRTTLGHRKGWVWYTLGQLCRLTSGERCLTRFPSLELHYCQFRLRSVLAGYISLLKLICIVAPHGAQIGAPNHLFYFITKGAGLKRPA